MLELAAVTPLSAVVPGPGSADLSALTGTSPASMRAKKPDRLHLMIDLETLSTRETAVIIQVGAVVFDPYTEYLDTNDVLNFNLDILDQQGRHIDPATLVWWVRENATLFAKLVGSWEARNVAYFASSIEGLLARNRIVNWWANSPNFDLGIIKSLYQTNLRAHKCPIEYFKERDVRTVRDMAKISKEDLAAEMIRRGFTGTKHCAYDDAVSQAVLVQMGYSKLGLTSGE